MGPDGVDRIREQWAVERPELETEPMGIFGRVWRIARLAGEAMEDAYARHGITRADFDVLATLRRAGEPFTLSPSALTASLMLTSGGTTGRLDRLERAGLVRRAPDPDDRRGLRISLTALGHEVVDAAVATGLDRQHELVADLPADAAHRLDELLRDLLASVTAHAAPAAPPASPAEAPSPPPAAPTR